MSDQDNETIFNETSSQTQGEEQQQAPETTQEVQPSGQGGFDDLLSSIKSPDGRQKYTSVEDALAALKHSQDHIQTLEKDNGDLRSQFEQVVEKVNEYETRTKTMEELISEFKQGQQKEPEKPSAAPEVDPEYITQQVESVLTRRQQQELAEKNIGQVISAFKEKYGEEKAEQAFYGKAEQLGVGREFINGLAAKSPQAVFELYGIEHKPKQTSAFQEPSVNTEGMTTTKKEPSAKVKFGASTSDMTAAWRAAGESIKN